jgi:hypothetical protein
MALISSIFPSGSQKNNWESEGENGLVKHLCSASEFLRGLRVQMRFGKLTRAPLRLLRLQVLAEAVECDWLARSTDPWDADLSEGIQQRHASLQTLRDAIDVRALLFSTLPHISAAHLRVYREPSNQVREMIITGYAQRSDRNFGNVHSIAMRAKNRGFLFYLDADILLPITSELKPAA